MTDALKFWGVIVSIVSLAAWAGAQQQKILTLEQAIATQAQIQATQADLRVQAAHTASEAQAAKEIAKENQQLLRQLLRER